MSDTTASSTRWWALGLLSLAQFLVILDTSIVGIALPEIQDSLGFSDTGLQWVFTAYVIAFGGLLLLGGRLADLFGARVVFVAGFVLLTAASLLAGLAASDAVLVLGRALQGAGAALIAPAAMALVLQLFITPGELAKAMSIWGAAAPAGGTAGVFLGGVVTEWAGWRWTFLLNVPVGVLVLAAVPLLLPKLAGRRGSVDLLGAAAVTGAVSLTVYATVTANDAGWASWRTLAAFSGGLLLAVGFVALERRRPEPLVRLGILRTPDLAAANVVMALLGAAWIPMWFFLNLYLQRVRGFDAFEGGLALLPMTLAIMVLMVGLTGRIVARHGFKRPLLAGLGLLALGIALLGRVPENASFAVDILPASLVAATGMSLAYIPVLIAALSRARPEEGGLASGLVNTSYQVGSALGLAAATAIATAIASDRLAGGGNEAAALTEGYGRAFLFAAAVALAAAGTAALTLGRTRAEAVAESAPALRDAA